MGRAVVGPVDAPNFEEEAELEGQMRAGHVGRDGKRAVTAGWTRCWSAIGGACLQGLGSRAVRAWQPSCPAWQPSCPGGQAARLLEDVEVEEEAVDLATERACRGSPTSIVSESRMHGAVSRKAAQI